MRYVIVGASAAGLAAVRAIRRNDPTGSVTLVSDEAKSYYRPLIPWVLDGRRTVSDVDIQGFEPQAFDIELVRDRATSVNPSSRSISLNSGGELEYDRLLVATGAAPLLPLIPGIERAFFMRTLYDAIRLRSAADVAETAVILGGGFVGIKTAQSLARMGLETTVVEERDQVLYPRVDRHGAELISARLREKGINIITETSISEISSGMVKLSSGSDLDAGVLVVAVGSRPAVDWLQGSNLNIRDGLVVDSKLETSAANIYAAGDVAETIDLIDGSPVVSALWSHAVEMGMMAGSNMSGTSLRHAGILPVMNASDFEDMPVVSLGRVAGDEGDVHTRMGPGGYRKLVFNGDRLEGALFIGDISHAGLYTQLVRNRIKVNSLKERAVQGTLGYADFLHPAGLPEI